MQVRYPTQDMKSHLPCRNGRAIGSCWELIGGAGVVRIKATSLLGPGDTRDGWTIQLSVPELSAFSFDGCADNFSRWTDGKEFVTAVKKGSERMITDKTRVKEELTEMGGDFVIRVGVVMIGGNRLALSMGAAPVSLERMKDLCTRKGAKMGSARIPVMELKLSTAREDGNVKRLDYCISESMWPEGPRGWLLFPLVEVLGEGSSNSADKLPESEGVRREMWERFRAMYLPTPVKDVFKYYDTTEVEGVEKTTKEWPGEDKRPKERWPQYKRLDGITEESESEGKTGSYTSFSFMGV